MNALSPKKTKELARYLFQEYSNSDAFALSKEAQQLNKAFIQHLKKVKGETKFKQSLDSLESYPVQQYQLACEWLNAFVKQDSLDHLEIFIPEAAILTILDGKAKFELSKQPSQTIIEQMKGHHTQVKEQQYLLDYHHFVAKLTNYSDHHLPKFKALQRLKKSAIESYKQQLKLHEFKPKVMSSFVRNKLISQVYLPLIGDNLAKQMGTAGHQQVSSRQGLLMLLSPPGYGKTTLIEYIASRLGLHFVKINGPALGHRTYSLDPKEAPNQTAARELERLNLSFELGDNLLLYIDDIQHCHSEFLQKFISLCDAQRKIEGVWKGQSKTYDLRTKRVAIVMAGNPYTESGEQFQVPDMLANRADIYNLGDIIGSHGENFRLSYIENALTSNETLASILGNDREDIFNLIKLAAGVLTQDQVDIKGNYSEYNMEESISVIKKLLLVREIVLKVNQRYIYSASIADQDRKEPPFLLQGSYRNMNRMAQKIAPIMTEEEVYTLIESHYEAEAQALSKGAEANWLLFREMTGKISKEEKKRLKEIRSLFLQIQATQNGQELSQKLGQLNEELAGIKAALLDRK
jgi:hypothetical protein